MKTKRLVTKGFGAVNLDEELRRANSCAVEKKWDAACRILEPLSQQYPKEKKVWQYLLDSSFSSGNMRLYQKACEGLFKVEPTGENAYELGGAYLNNMHPLMALQTFRQALELEPDHKLAPQAKDTVRRLEPILQNTLTQMGLTEADGLEIALLHEQGQAYMEQGDYAASREAEEKVLQQYPHLVSARNNLSLLSWMEGDPDAAISTAQAVLKREPDNIHALSNLIRFLVISGDSAPAPAYGEQLKASQAEAWDGWTKKVEGLTYLADDLGIVEVWQQAPAAEMEDSPLSALFYHLSAVALARTGDVKSAIAQWKIALDLNPSLALARENLSDLRKPRARQHGAWPLSWEQWLMPKSSAQLQQIIQTSLNSTQSDKLLSRFKNFLSTHADVVAMLPRILERGSPEGQELVLSTAEQLKTPQLLNPIKDFATSQNGTDQMRYRAANLAASAKLIPKDRVTLWMAGEWRELMLMAYEFHGEPILKHSQRVDALLKEALFLLRQDGEKQAKEAEALLKKALVLEPESPDLIHNLAMAFRPQGREDESIALLRDLVTRYPDYLFAPAFLAKLHLENGDLEAAEALLKPFLDRERFHFLEFSAFMDAYIEVLLAKQDKKVARSWLKMWEDVYSQLQLNDPTLDYWKKRLGPKLKFPQLFG
ncbi:MAG: tetratricopeptide repeat protein [Prochloraceae cyanobacterium]|nr:tetratricopeptide repeat protein [Prochloraceae cyanobacterium]